MGLEGFRFTATHEWVRAEDGLAYVGVTQYAATEMTRVTGVELPEVGRGVAAGDELVLVDSLKATFSVIAPVPGVVRAVNTALSGNPGLVTSAPYAEGWMVCLELAPQASLDALLTAPQYLELLQSVQR